MGWLAFIIISYLKDGNHTKPFPEWESVLFGLSIIVGVVLWIVGLCYYVMAKGHSSALGLLGLFHGIGLLILIVLPDKAKGHNDEAS